MGPSVAISEMASYSSTASSVDDCSAVPTNVGVDIIKVSDGIKVADLNVLFSNGTTGLEFNERMSDLT